MVLSTDEGNETTNYCRISLNSSSSCLHWRFWSKSFKVNSHLVMTSAAYHIMTWHVLYSIHGICCQVHGKCLSLLHLSCHICQLCNRSSWPPTAVKPLLQVQMIDEGLPKNVAPAIASITDDARTKRRTPHTRLCAGLRQNSHCNKKPDPGSLFRSQNFRAPRLSPASHGVSTLH